VFNKEQQAHMHYLSSCDPATLCWCGWDRLGECNTPSNCNITCPGLSAKDKIAASCPLCRGEPSPRPAGQVTHRIACKGIQHDTR
jgi:hypothetical protein